MPMTSFDKSVDDKTVKHAKLEWYREVLSLEPNSKLFLPLARLLAELGTEEQNADLVNEAFNILRRGLDIHPDFMEARLFLIELLNMCGCKAQCGAEVARLASLFLSYPDFWDAWREYAITENESNDFTVALGFMSAIMRNKSLSIVQVLEAGLNSLKSSSSPVFSSETIELAKNIQDSNLASMPSESFSQISSCLHTINPPVYHEEAAQENHENIPTENPEDNPAAPVFDSPVDFMESEAHEITENIADDIVNDIADDEKAELTAEQADNADLSEIMENPKESEFSEDEDIPPYQEVPANEFDSPIIEDEDDLSTVLPKSHLENYASFAELQKNLQEQILQEKTRSTKETLAALIKDANITVEPSTTSPFRTKSMADLLAEQGDYKGALDIYQELLHKGYGNKEELSERIADIKMLAPELVVEIDKSKLLAIDDFVDTSFFETGSTETNIPDPQEVLSENEIFSENEMFAENAMIADETIMEKDIQEDLPAKNMDMDIVRQENINEATAETTEEITGKITEEIPGETAGKTIQEQDSPIEASAEISSEEISSEENTREEKSSPQTRNVADLLTKLAERLEIRGKK